MTDWESGIYFEIMSGHPCEANEDMVIRVCRSQIEQFAQEIRDDYERSGGYGFEHDMKYSLQKRGIE